MPNGILDIPVMHAMAPRIACVFDSAIAAGALLAPLDG